MEEKVKLSFCGFKEKALPTFEEKVVSGGKYLYYGKDNKFPQYLFGLYLHSAILQSIVNGTSDFVVGNGVEINHTYWADYINKDGDTIEDIIKKLTIDYLIFGGFALKVNRNSFKEISDIQWLDMQSVRLNEEGTVAYYYPDGYKYNGVCQEFPVFNNTDKPFSSVFYFKGHISRGVYPIPKYIGALAAVETSTEISKFHLSTIKKNFSGNFIINYNDSNYTEEQKQQIKEAIKKQYTGADNAGSVMLAFNNGKDNAVTVTRIPEDNFDKKYESLKDNTMKEIFISFRAVPQLFGFTTEGTGFNKQEFLEAFELYNKTMVSSIQKDIIRTFTKIFEDKLLTFKPFTLEV